MIDFDEQVTLLKATLKDEEERLAELESIQDRCRRLRKAIAVLTDEGKSVLAPAKRDRSKSNVWRPKAETIAKVKAAIDGADHPVRSGEIRKATGLSDSAIGRSISYLRDQEEVRLAGKDGAAYLYAPMKNSVSHNGVTA